MGILLREKNRSGDLFYTDIQMNKFLLAATVAAVAFCQTPSRTWPTSHEHHLGTGTVRTRTLTRVRRLGCAKPCWHGRPLRLIAYVKLEDKDVEYAWPWSPALWISKKELQ